MEIELHEALINFVNIILQIVVPILATAVGSYVVILIRRAAQFIQSRDDGQQWELVLAVVDRVVKAAEQAGLKGALENEGRAKKAWALNELSRILASYGITGIDLDTLGTLIEAALREGVHKEWPPLAALSVETIKE